MLIKNKNKISYNRKCSILSFFMHEKIELENKIDDR